MGRRFSFEEMKFVARECCEQATPEFVMPFIARADELRIEWSPLINNKTDKVFCLEQKDMKFSTYTNIWALKSDQFDRKTQMDSSNRVLPVPSGFIDNYLQKCTS
jgi:hypothetical protein